MFKMLKEECTQEDENLHISNHSWDENRWNLYGDSICDTDSELSEDNIPNLEAIGQPSVVDELAEKKVVNSEKFQPCSPMYVADLFQPFSHVFDSQY